MSERKMLKVCETTNNVNHISDKRTQGVDDRYKERLKILTKKTVVRQVSMSLNVIKCLSPKETAAIVEYC